MKTLDFIGIAAALVFLFISARAVDVRLTLFFGVLGACYLVVTVVAIAARRGT